MNPLSQDEQETIEALKKQSFSTKRTTVPELEACLYDAIPVLDHGFVRVIDYMGDDAAIVQAARVSYGKGTKQMTQDKALISYLMRHRHTSPFEMNEIKLHIKLPIFIARQWIRHRTANVNEYSARYSILDREFYTPSHVSPQSTTNRQGRDLLERDEEWSERILKILKEDSLMLYDHYETMLNDPSSSKNDPSMPQLARELARMNLSLNYYTQWYWKIDLHNLLHFLSLRADEHAQQEIQDYAYVLLDIVKKWCPFVYESFLEYRKNSFSLSASAIKVLKAKLLNQDVFFENSGLSKREWAELCSVFPEIA